MLPFFKKPYPYNPLSRKDLISGFLVGCFVAFFLVVFEPFGISVWETPYRFIKILGFGLVSFLCPLLFRLVLLVLIRRTKPEETWNVWKEILALLFALLLIAIGNLVYGHLIGITGLGASQFLLAIVATFLLGLFPVTANVALKYSRFVALNQKEAVQMEQEVKDYQQRLQAETLPGKEASQASTEVLVFIAENEKDRLEMEPENLLYIESADNYASIVFLKDGQPSKQLIRASLKRLGSQIPVPYIIRCHRAYIINLKQVGQVRGNAQGYKITFKTETVAEVPVSRSYGKELFERMKTIG